MNRVILAIAAVLALASSAAAQTVKNPTGIAFNSVDHDNSLVTGYEVDIVLAATPTTVIQTLAIAKSATVKLTDGSIKVSINVQPVAFGTYRFVARTIAGTLKSDNSPASDAWERGPGAPTKPTPQ